MVDDAPLADDDIPSAELIELAETCGITTSFWSFFGERTQVPAAALRAILRGMGIDADSEPAARAALATAQQSPWRETVPPSLVVRRGTGEMPVFAAEDMDPQLTIVLEDGTRRDLRVLDEVVETQVIDGRTVCRRRAPLPDDLPLGWHEVHAFDGRADPRVDAEITVCTLVVTPWRLEPPRSRPANNGRSWGLMAQLYSVRSRRSWGIGDFVDLAALAELTGTHGGDFLLINPVHAAEVTPPIEPSPYLPATRRFIAPLYIRPDAVEEISHLSSADRARVDEAWSSAADGQTDGLLIDRDTVWRAKKEVLEVLFAVPRNAERERAFQRFVAREGIALADFALWCAIEEHYAGTLPSGQSRPAEARDPRSPLVAELRERLAGRIAFHTWLQWIADDQLAAAQDAAMQAGMRIGIMHDLAVGVHPLGADAWALRSLYAPGVSVGAPPDMYNQQGQNWFQPPWLPSALARTGYAPLRDLVRSLLRHAGALRIDHIIGLFRLWWIPDGLGAGAGAYVRYDHEAMIGVLILEAHRAGAVIIGEDLGNVEPWVREYLSSRGVLGTSILWFENDEHGPLPPEHYRQDVLATITTHDLPPTAGYLMGEHVELRARLGLLTEPVEQARAAAVHEWETMRTILLERRLVTDDATEEEVIAALHRYLAASPARLVGVALVDAVGERRTQNQPGTYDEYPNWRVPLADQDGRSVTIEELGGHARFRSLVGAVDRAIRVE